MDMKRETAINLIFCVAVGQAIGDFFTSLNIEPGYVYFTLVGFWFLKSRSTFAKVLLILGAIGGLAQNLVEFTGLLEPTNNLPFAVAYFLTVFFALYIDRREQHTA